MERFTSSTYNASKYKVFIVTLNVPCVQCFMSLGFFFMIRMSTTTALIIGRNNSNILTVRDTVQIIKLKVLCMLWVLRSPGMHI